MTAAEAAELERRLGALGLNVRAGALAPLREMHATTRARAATTTAPAIDLTAFLHSDERAKLVQLAALGVDADVLSGLLEATCRPRMAAVR